MKRLGSKVGKELVEMVFNKELTIGDQGSILPKRTDIDQLWERWLKVSQFEIADQDKELFKDWLATLIESHFLWRYDWDYPEREDVKEKISTLEKKLKDIEEILNDFHVSSSIFVACNVVIGRRTFRGRTATGGKGTGKSNITCPEMEKNIIIIQELQTYCEKARSLDYEPVTFKSTCKRVFLSPRKRFLRNLIASWISITGKNPKIGIKSPLVIFAYTILSDLGEYEREGSDGKWGKSDATEENRRDVLRKEVGLLLKEDSKESIKTGFKILGKSTTK